MKFLENNTVLVKVWLVVAMTLVFIITLPVFIVVLPFAAAYQLANNIYNPKATPSSVRKIDVDFGPDIFSKWFGTGGIGNKEGN